MRQSGIFILTPLARWLFLFAERHNLPLGPLALAGEAADILAREIIGKLESDKVQ